MSDSRFTLGIHFNEQDELEVFAVDSEDGPDDTAATFMALIKDWIADQAFYDGKLHPYVDDTLNMLAMLTHAQRVIVEHLEPDDPHKADMDRVLDTMASFIERLKDSLR